MGPKGTWVESKTSLGEGRSEEGGGHLCRLARMKVTL